MDSPESETKQAKEAALTRVLLSKHKELLDYAKRKLGALQATTTAEDLVSQTAQRAFQGLANLQATDDSVIAVWLFSILDRVLTNAARKELGTARKHHQRMERLASDLANALGTHSSGLTRRAYLKEMAERLRQAMTQLPDDARLAIELYHLEDRSIAEVAAQIGRTEDATAKFLERTRGKLAQLMGSLSESDLPGYDRKKRRKGENDEPS